MLAEQIAAGWRAKEERERLGEAKIETKVSLEFEMRW